MTEPFELTIAEASQLIRNRELSPTELMESCLRRSELIDDKLRIWANIDPGFALEAAAKASSILPNPASSPLHGIPVGVKDIFNVAGVPNTAGSELYSHFVPQYDSAPVEFLKRAGAIIMGKTITTEFAMGDPPVTKNPWNSFHTPGGSSSGSAVGVASKVFPTALGSQTAGSVIRPASFNGIIGFKPSFGLISRFGVLPVSSSLDTVGYFTRCVEDIALVLEALAGHDNRDSFSGKVFFATEVGLCSFRSGATKSNNNFKNVLIFPNPVRHDYDGLITISGLNDNTNVKITDVSGNLVFETTTEGGSASWNGKSFSGNKVKTGVYLFFCTNSLLNESVVKKVLMYN